MCLFEFQSRWLSRGGYVVRKSVSLTPGITLNVGVLIILWAAYRNSAWLEGQPCPISSSAIHFSSNMSMLFKMLLFSVLAKHIWFVLNLFKASWMGLHSTFVIGKGWLSRKGWLPLWWLPFSDFPHLVPTLLPACRGKCRRRMLCVYSLWLKMRM